MRDVNAKVLNKKEEVFEEEYQHVTFLIGDETYGASVSKVKEIISMTTITHVPNTADFMEGVINLRGIVVPVVDMRKRFYMEKRPYDAYTVVIIVELGDKLVGMIVDAVSDVVSIPISNIQSAPHFASRVKTDFIQGIAKMENNLIIILNIDKILSEDEIDSIVVNEKKDDKK